MYLSSCEYYWIVKSKDLMLIIEWKIMLLFYWLYTNNGSLRHLRAVNTFYQNSSSLSTLYGSYWPNEYGKMKTRWKASKTNYKSCEIKRWKACELNLGDYDGRACMTPNKYDNLELVKTIPGISFIVNCCLSFTYHIKIKHENNLCILHLITSTWRLEIAKQRMLEKRLIKNA